MRSGTWFSGKRDGLGIQFNLGQEGVSGTTYGIDSMLQAAGLDEELMALLDNGKLIIASPAQAAQMQNDTAMLEIARAAAKNKAEQILGRYIIWHFEDEDDWRGEVVGIDCSAIIFGPEHELYMDDLFNPDFTIIIAPTQKEAEARLALLQGNSNNTEQHQLPNIPHPAPRRWFFIDKQFLL